MRKIDRTKGGVKVLENKSVAPVYDSVEDARASSVAEAAAANVSPSAVMNVSPDGYATGDWPKVKTPEDGMKASTPDVSKKVVTKESTNVSSSSS